SRTVVGQRKTVARGQAQAELGNTADAEQALRLGDQLLFQLGRIEDVNQLGPAQVWIPGELDDLLLHQVDAAIERLHDRYGRIRRLLAEGGDALDHDPGSAL